MYIYNLSIDLSICVHHLSTIYLSMSMYLKPTA